jgi:TorA maturation chaperone TorD
MIAIAVRTTETPRISETEITPERQRADVYSLLSTLLLSPPDEDTLDQLSQLQLDHSAIKPMQLAWAQLKLAALRAKACDVELEYGGLFIGLGRGELVPYGCWYLTGMLMDKPLAQLRHDLAQLGLARNENLHEPEDHVALLCQTMSVLIQHPNEYSYETQRQFFEHHLAPWIGRFCDDLQQAQHARFYRSVGHLGEQFFQLERQAFSMLHQ